MTAGISSCRFAASGSQRGQPQRASPVRGIHHAARHPAVGSCLPPAETTLRGQPVTTTSPAKSPVPRGRPRDPALEDRVYAAAIGVFGQKGWSGFTIDGVAKAAGVGKASLYLRWNSKQELLFDALAARASVDVSIDTGDIRSDLRHLGAQLLGMFWADGGVTYMRLVV